MIVLVTGGRRYWNHRLVERTLSDLHRREPITRLVHGGADGADTCAARWAHMAGVEHQAYPADWDRYGRRAGPLRNQNMYDAEAPDLVVAFPGGDGTAGMVRIARAGGTTVMEVPDDGYLARRRPARGLTARPFEKIGRSR